MFRNRNLTIGVLLSFGLSFSRSPALANGPFGLGLVLGGPSGISAKYVLSNKNAIAGALAWHYHNGVQIQGDYLWTNSDFIKTSANSIEGYVGVGVRLQTWSGGYCGRYGRCYDYYTYSGTGIGVRVPLGLSYSFNPHPFDTFIEIVPTLDLVPGTGLDLDVALGARFFF